MSTISPAEVAFLGHAFLTPDSKSLAQIAEDLGLSSFREMLDNRGVELEIEYNRLFLNPLGSLCPLWQSAYCDEPHLMGEAHLSALGWYRRYDVEPARLNDPADHVGLLLLFYARLLELEADGSILDRFWEEHLMWIVRFCESVRSESKDPFYSAVALRAAQLMPARTLSTCTEECAG